MINTSFLHQFTHQIYLIHSACVSGLVTKYRVNVLKNDLVLGVCLYLLEYEKNSFENFFSKENTLPEDFQYLINSDKVLLSPHVAGWTVESKIKLAETIVHKVAAMLDQHNSIK